MTNTRIIYNNSYYKLLAALWSQKMQLLLDDYHKKLENQGVPTPNRFFKEIKEYHEWSAVALEKDIVYPGMINEIIKKFFKKDIDEEIKNGFTWYIYFGIDKPPVKFTHAVSIVHSEMNDYLTVSFDIYPWTIREDIIYDSDLWRSIRKQQESLINHVPQRQRNMEWRNFDRDFSIYELYLKLNKEKRKATPKALVESEEFKKIQRQYKVPDSIDSMIPQIILHCKKRTSRHEPCINQEIRNSLFSNELLPAPLL